MLTPTVAAIVLIAAILLLLILIPVLDGSQKFHKYISLRYTLVALALIMALGCILDFSHLADTSRDIVLTGGLVLVGLFVIVRSLEKLKLGNKIINVSAEKGDMKLTANLQNKVAKNENNEANEDLEATETNKTNGTHKVFE